MIKKCFFLLLLLTIALSFNLVFAEKVSTSLKITEEDIPNFQSVKYADISDVKGLFHPNLAEYARAAGIDLKRIVSVLKISTQQKESTPIYFVPSSRYRTRGYRSATAKIFEIVRVRVGEKRKILVLLNDQTIDEYNVEKFHKGWKLAELSEKYELDKLHDFFLISKHPWPGGEAIYTNLNIKQHKLEVAITYEQPIRGYELHSECNYLFSPAKGALVFKKVTESTEEGPVP
jgi:hypothetical protein